MSHSSFLTLLLKSPATPPLPPHFFNSKELPLLRHRGPRCLDPGINPLAAHLTDGWWWRRRNRLRIILSMATASWQAVLEAEIGGRYRPVDLFFQL